MVSTLFENFSSPYPYLGAKFLYLNRELLPPTLEYAFTGVQEAARIRGCTIACKPVKGPDMVRGLSAGKQDYIVSINQNYTNREPKSVFTISICIF